MSPYQNLIVKDLLLSDQLDMRWELVEQNVYKRPFKCYKIQMAPSLDIQHVMKFSKKSHAIHQQHILSAACLCDMVLLFFSFTWFCWWNCLHWLNTTFPFWIITVVRWGKSHWQNEIIEKHGNFHTISSIPSDWSGWKKLKVKW